MVCAVEETEKLALLWGDMRKNLSKTLENRTLLPRVSTLLLPIVGWSTIGLNDLVQICQKIWRISASQEWGRSLAKASEGKTHSMIEISHLLNLRI